MLNQKDYGMILRRVLRQWMVVLMVSICAALLAGIVVSRMHHLTFRTQALIVINSKSASNGEVDMAEDTVEAFREVITGNLLQKKVAETMGLAALPGNISCQGVTNTNMMYLTVEASSPRNVMITMNGVLDHYAVVMDEIVGNVVLHVLEKPVTPTAPVTSYLESQVLLVVFAGCAFGLIVLLFLYYYLRDDIKNEHDIEKKLDTKLFAAVYHENTSKGLRLSLRKRKKTGILITNPTVGFRYIETFQKMCTKLEYRSRKKEIKSIVITSVQENEGKSTVAVNLALSLARIGKKVLLVDLDLRKPAVFKLFEMPYDQGQLQISDVLNGTAEVSEAVRTLDVMQKAEGVPLSVLAGNRSYRNSIKLLTRENMEHLLNEIAPDVDYVILDTPPLSLVADAEEIMQYADAGLLIVRQNAALAKYINDAVDTFRSSDCELLGCVLNDVEAGIWGRQLLRSDGYNYRYKYGYGYGRYYGKEKAK